MFWYNSNFYIAKCVIKGSHAHLQGKISPLRPLTWDPGTSSNQSAEDEPKGKTIEESFAIESPNIYVDSNSAVRLNRMAGCLHNRRPVD